MAKTPSRLVHWAMEASLSDFGSPFSEGSSSDTDSASSLQYINSQLIAHGFTYKPGLSLEGTNKEDADRVVKCLLAMLSQRIDDMSRTEDLSTKIRTLSYDHERLLSMYRAATDKAGNAERETSLHKSRLATTTRTLQTTESAHKHTTAELQRTRTALQAIRATHAAEIKKLEKEKERVLDRWGKLADQQLKLGTTASGLKFANAEVVEASDVQMRGKGKGFLEVAAEQAQEARDALFNENRRLKGLLLTTANEIQRLVHSAKGMSTSEAVEEPAVITTVNLFPMSPPDAANDKFASLLAGLKDAICKLGQPVNASTTSAQAVKEKQKESEKAVKDKQEVDRLNSVIETLRKQLHESEKQTESYAAQTQELVEKLTREEHASKEREPSVDLMTTPALDEELERLHKRAEELEEDRRKFTEAAVKLGKEKAMFETERLKFIEEKRAWQVDMVLSHLPPTPIPQSSEAVSSAEPEQLAPLPDIVLEQPAPPPRMPRGSPRKGVPVGGGKRRAVRRSSMGTAPLSPKAKGKEKAFPLTSRVIPAFETEVIPSSPSFPAPTFKTTLSSAPGPQLQPPTMAPVFVLPPPSPAARLPPMESLLSTVLIPSTSDSEVPSDISTNPPLAPQTSSAPMSATDIPVATATSSGQIQAAPVATNTLAVPSTPGARRPFPMAKPLAQRMIHAYSPVKPSPLSRILMLANSPGSPPGPPMQPVSEEDESSPDVSPTPAFSASNHKQPTGLSLAAELGLPEEDADENPLLDKKGSHGTDISLFSRPKSAMGHRAPAPDKARARTKPSSSRSRAVVPTEKENVKRTKAKVTNGSSLANSRVVSGGIVKKVAKPTVKSSVVPASTTVPPKIMPRAGPSKGGPRRVPIDSAEAAPTSRTWKG